MREKKHLIKKGFKYVYVGMFYLIICALIDRFIGIHYVINDDLAMRDIASGIRSGTPDGHLIYIKYILGWILSLFYRHISMSLDWYGIFMLGMIIVCWTLLTCRIWEVLRSLSLKICLTVWLFSLFVTHIFEIQWTICAAICGVTAVFFYSTISTTNKYSRMIQKVISVFLLAVSYLIRDKVFWLVAACGFLPVIYSEWKNNSFRKSISSLVVVFANILLVIGCVEVVDMMAYNKKEWQEYYSFNTARSYLYDYYGIPDYDENIEFYTSENISENTYTNLRKYAFIYDPNINEESVNKIAEYSKLYNVEETFGERIEEFWGFFTGQDFSSLHLTLTMLFVGMLIIAIKVNDKSLYIVCGGEIAVGVFVMLYLIYKGRFPARIIYTMCLIFAFSWSAILIYALRKKEQKKRFGKTPLAIACIGVVVVGAMCHQLIDDSRRYENRNMPYDQVKQYANEHAENLYLLPSNSFGGYTDRLDFFREKYSGKILPTGGWVCNSPLTKQRLYSMGINDIPEDFIACEKVYFFAWENTSVEYIVASLEEQLRKTVTCEVVDAFETTNGVVNVYKMASAD